MLAYGLKHKDILALLLGGTGLYFLARDWSGFWRVVDESKRSR